MCCLDQISVAHGCHVDQAVYEASSELLQLLATNLLITSTPSVAWEFLLAMGGNWGRALLGKCSRGLEKIILK